jgi:hypothetical protein
MVANTTVGGAAVRILSMVRGLVAATRIHIAPV